MKVRFLALLLLFLPACHYRLPDMPGQDTPPRPFVQALDAQRRKLASVKAVARVETERKGRRRSYESVTIVMDGGCRMRVDGFGPLGESLFALLWDGNRILLRPPGEPQFISVGQAGLERAMGVALTPEELCAALGGNVIISQGSGTVQAACESNGSCLVQVSGDRGTRRVQVFRPAGETADGMIPGGEDLYEGDKLVYRGRFLERSSIAGYSFPMLVMLENPDRSLRLTVRYEDVEVNVPVDEALFHEEGEGAGR